MVRKELYLRVFIRATYNWGGHIVGKSTINGVFSIVMWKIVKVPEGIAGCIQTSIREYGYESKLKTQKNPRILVDV